MIDTDLQKVLCGRIRTNRNNQSRMDATMIYTIITLSITILSGLSAVYCRWKWREAEAELEMLMRLYPERYLKLLGYALFEDEIDRYIAQSSAKEVE